MMIASLQFNPISRTSNWLYTILSNIRVEMSGDFVKVAESREIGPSSMKAVEVDGEKVCVINAEGNYYAIGNVCTHVGGPLDEGTLEGFEVECPWHGSKFDIRTGEPTKPPATRAVPKYEVKIDGNNILVRKQK